MCAIIADHDIGASLEEFSDQRGDFLGSALVDQCRKPARIGKKYRYLREVTRLPVDVSNVAQVRIFLTAVDSQEAPSSSPQADKMRLSVQPQHDAPQNGLRF